MSMPVLMQGKGLEGFAARYGIKRRKYLWIIPESEKSLRRRLMRLISEAVHRETRDY